MIAITVEDVQTRVAAIKDLAGAGAHVQATRLEASLYTDVLTAIAVRGATAPGSSDLAREALLTGQIEFTRTTSPSYAR
jgi:hypothetical protein